MKTDCLTDSTIEGLEVNLFTCLIRLGYRYTIDEEEKEKEKEGGEEKHHQHVYKTESERVCAKLSPFCMLYVSS